MSATAIAFLFSIAVAHILKLTKFLVQVLIQIIIICTLIRY
jgi:hypothetical protein